MPLPKEIKEDFTRISYQDVDKQLADPENDIGNSYLEKRTIHEELNSPAVLLLREYETEKTVTQPKGKGKIDPKRAEEEALGDPWIDPILAISGGFGGTLALGLRAGAKLVPTLFRALTAGVAAGGMEYPIGAVTEDLEEVAPALALPFSVITGMLSGVTIERSIEKAVVKALTKGKVKPAKELVKKSVKAVRANLEAGKVPDDMTKAAQETINLEFLKKPEVVSKLELTKKYVRETGEKIGKGEKFKIKEKYPKEWAVADQAEKYKKSLWGKLPESFRRNRGINEYTTRELEEKIRVSLAKVSRETTAIDDFMKKRKAKLIEVPDVQKKVDQFLSTDISDLPEKAININFARIESPDDIKKVITKTANIFMPEIQEARRGVRSMELTEKVADTMGLSVEQLLKRRKGEVFNAETAVAARKMLVSSAQRLNELAQKVSLREASDIDKFAFQKQLSLHYAIQAEVSGMTTEAGRALQSFNIIAKESKGALKQIDETMRRLNNAAFKDPATGKQMRPEDVADLILSIDSVEGISTFARQVRKANSFDMITEAWINGLLSGPQTHAVNTMSNALVALWQVPERVLASSIGKVMPGKQEIKSAEALYQSFGLIEGFKDGLKAFTKNIITGDEPDQFTKMDLPRRRAISAQNFNVESGSIAARAIDLIGEGIRIPTRFLGAEDAFFKSVGYRMELNARAFRQASEEGLKGPAMAKRIKEIIADPPDDISLAAVDAANYQTFTRELGEGGQAGMKFLNKFPALRFVVPFVRTPANIIKFAGERTPLAFASKNVRAEIMAGGARRDLALAKISAGSMIMATMATLTAEGKITGGGPEDFNLKAIKRNTGWQPYSIKVGDKYYAYNRLEPMGMLFGIAADTAEIIGQVGEEEAGDLATAGAMAFVKNVTSKTWLRGVSEAISALDSPERYGQRFLQNYAKSLVPTGVAQIERISDPVLRERYSEKGFWFETYNSIKERVPGWSKTLPPRRNLWGEPIIPEGGLGPDIISPIYTSTVKESPIDEELIRLKAGIGKPKKIQSIHGEPIALMPKEYDRILILMNTIKLPQTGKNLKNTLDHLVTKDLQYRSMNDDMKEDMIRDYILQAKSMAQEALYNESKELRSLIDELQLQRMMSLQRSAIR